MAHVGRIETYRAEGRTAKRDRALAAVALIAALRNGVARERGLDIPRIFAHGIPGLDA